MLFRNRQHAGQRLAEALSDYRDMPLHGEPAPVVLALPRGGVPVGYEVARQLSAPLDVFIVRKLGVPGYPEYAMGALASGGVRVMNDEVVRQLGIDQASIDRIAAAEQQELERRERAYRGDRPRPALAGRSVILVDDGLATGATMRAAVRAVRAQGPARLIVAVPVAAADSADDLAREVDRLVAVATPEPFFGVGRWYDDFSQTDDREVTALLERAQLAERTARPGQREARADGR